MNTAHLKILLTAASLGVLALTASADAAPRIVNCDEGQSIQSALDSAPAAGGKRFEIVATGNCYERVTIRRDDVTIGGDATIYGTIRVFQASDVWIDDITVTAPDNGINVGGNNHVRLSNVKLIGNEGVGLSVSSRADVWLRGNTNISENWASGVYLMDASLRIDDAVIFGNVGNGVEAMMSTVLAQRRARILSNEIHGIDANFQSSIILRGEATIENNYEVGIHLSADSGLLTMEESQISGNHSVNVLCDDIESSAEFLGHTPDGVVCTDFNQNNY